MMTGLPGFENSTGTDRSYDTVVETDTEVF
jgi:hypothetical protein